MVISPMILEDRNIWPEIMLSGVHVMICPYPYDKTELYWINVTISKNTVFWTNIFNPEFFNPGIARNIFCTHFSIHTRFLYKHNVYCTYWTDRIFIFLVGKFIVNVFLMLSYTSTVCMRALRAKKYNKLWFERKMLKILFIFNSITPRVSIPDFHKIGLLSI